MDLPNDSMMLLSFINLKLRDFYKDLDALCEDLNIEKASLINKLANIDYEYDATLNKFV